MIEKDNIISEQLPYEINMLRYAYQRLQSPLHEQAEINVFIECFCVHARNLLDFFWYKQPKKKNYAVARQFTSGSYNPFGGVNPKANGLCGKLNDQIVHVTYGRTNVTEEKLGDEPRAYLKAVIEKEIGNFTSHLDASYRHLWNITTHTVIGATGPIGPIDQRNTTGVGATGSIGPTDVSEARS
jgi:hypothetical protein